MTVHFEFRFFFAWFLVQDPDPNQVGSNPGIRIRDGTVRISIFLAWFLVQDPDPSQEGSNPGSRIRNGHNSKFFSLFLPFGFEFRDPDPIQVDPNPEFRSVTVLFLKFSILVPGIQD